MFVGCDEIWTLSFFLHWKINFWNSASAGNGVRALERNEIRLQSAFKPVVTV